MIDWQTGDEIKSQERLEAILEHLEGQALVEGLHYETAVMAVRRKANARNARELALMEMEEQHG